jgi:hypothetical protein
MLQYACNSSSTTYERRRGLWSTRTAMCCCWCRRVCSWSVVAVGRFSWVQPGSRHLQSDPPSSLYSHGAKTRTEGTNAFSASQLLDESWFGEKKVHDQVFVMVLCLCFCLSPFLRLLLLWRTSEQASKQWKAAVPGCLLLPCADFWLLKMKLHDLYLSERALTLINPLAGGNER